MSIQVPISTVDKTASIALMIIAKQRQVIPPHSRAAIVIATTQDNILKLPDYDIIFEPARQDALKRFTQLVDSKCKAILMENSTDGFIVVPEQHKIGQITDDNAEAMTAVEEMDVYHLAQVPSKRQGSLGRLLTKGMLAAAATSMMTMAVLNGSIEATNRKSRQETILSSGVTVFANNLQT